MRPPEMPDGLVARDARDSDADALFRLVGAAYDEYPGCVLDPEGVDADLQQIATTSQQRNGAFWVVEDGRGEIVACVGLAPTEVDGEPGVELKRLYVAASQRRRGVGARLAAHVEATARQLERPVVELWSDTRFESAHRLYTRLGYEPTGETRTLHDPSDTTEYRFVKTLRHGNRAPDRAAT